MPASRISPTLDLTDPLSFPCLSQAYLPLGSQSLVYGSADAGKTVHNREPRFDDAMRRAAKELNLRSHIVGRAGNTVELHSAVDIGTTFTHCSLSCSVCLSLSVVASSASDSPSYPLFLRGPHWVRQSILSSGSLSFIPP
jgi:hypothetical protein